VIEVHVRFCLRVARLSCNGRGLKRISDPYYRIEAGKGSRFTFERCVASAHGKVKAMRDDTKETIVQILTVAAVVLASLLTKRDIRLP